MKEVTAALDATEKKTTPAKIDFAIGYITGFNSGAVEMSKKFEPCSDRPDA